MSAIGVDRGSVSDFSRSKGVGDSALQASGLEWVILRPSVVVGRAAYGGSALFRGLASLPILPKVPDSGPLDVVQLSDVAETVVRLLEEETPGRIALDLTGPDRLDFAQASSTAFPRGEGSQEGFFTVLTTRNEANASGMAAAIREQGGVRPLGALGHRHGVRAAEGRIERLPLDRRAVHEQALGVVLLRLGLFQHRVAPGVAAERGGVVRIAELQSQGYLYLRP